MIKTQLITIVHIVWKARRFWRFQLNLSKMSFIVWACLGLILSFSAHSIQFSMHHQTICSDLLVFHQHFARIGLDQPSQSTPVPYLHRTSLPCLQVVSVARCSWSQHLGPDVSLKTYGVVVASMPVWNTNVAFDRSIIAEGIGFHALFNYCGGAFVYVRREYAGAVGLTGDNVVANRGKQGFPRFLPPI